MGLHRLGYDICVITRGAEVGDFPFEVVNVEQKSDYQSILKNKVADICFFHGWHHWVSDWAIPVFSLRYKTVLVSHGTNFNVRFDGWKGQLWWWRNRLKAWRFAPKMKQFDHYVFLSRYPDPQRMSDLLLAQKMELNNYSIIPNGVTPDFDSDTSLDFRAQFHISHRNILLCVGNFHYAKGQRELIDWFCDLDLPDTVLVLIGSRFNAFAESLIKRAGHRFNHDIFIFEQLDKESLKAAYYAAKLFLSATYTETQPLVLLDAMAAGLPFLCREVGAVPALEGGIYFKKEADFKQKLLSLLQNPAQQAALRQAGKRAINQYYNWKIIAKRYQQLIEQLLPE